MSDLKPMDLDELAGAGSTPVRRASFVNPGAWGIKPEWAEIVNAYAHFGIPANSRQVAVYERWDGLLRRLAD